ncbi:hypothetical protein [Campylobacter iguaniorum]|uniref:hypothetical protein n=1 Tax=Campylobacter iguaniorum TaxID=1244531 RepID=UPI0007C8975A|nr:hypothetical protein [Campylobacter iguaniorum]
MPKNSFKIVSHTGNRVRLTSNSLKDCDEKLLEALVLKLDEISSVRVNKLAKSIIFTYNYGLNSILKTLETINIKELKAANNLPSKSEIYKSAATLALTSLSNNNKLNALATLYSSSNLFKEGALELLHEGLTSKSLEALAVGVSLARGDYPAANGTNLLLSLGEYIEESTVHKSDDLIKELAKPNVKEAWIEIKNSSGEKELKLINTKDIKVGDIVVVGAGQSIAIIAKASADISLLKDDICSVSKAKLIANKTMSKINANFKATVGINSAILLGATFGKLSPIQTAILHNATTIALLLNSLNSIKTK